MVLRYTKWVADQLHIQRSSYLPAECCAILLGRSDKANPEIMHAENVCPIQNVSESRIGLFLMNPQQQYNIVSSVKDGGGNKFVKIAAHYHSHPKGSMGYPSHTDFTQALKAWSIGIHVIHGDDGINAFYWDGDQFTPIKTEVTD